MWNRGMLYSASLFLVVLAIMSPASAQPVARGDATTIAAAVEYLEAYQDLDLGSLEARFTESASFIDPTSRYVPSIGGPFIWRGRADILAGIEAWKRSGVSSLHYEVEDVYESSGCVVFIGTIGPIVSTPDGAVQYRYRVVTIVTIEEGLVVEHRDYTDYAGAARIAEAAP